jgi:hypothetical protein
MKKAFLALLFAAAAQTQAPQLLPVWNGQTYVFAKLGPTLKLANGQLDAVVSVGPPGPTGPGGPQGPAGTTRRHVDVLLTFDQTAQGWILPAPATGFSIANLAIYVNGLRYHSGGDFSANGGIVKALSTNMDPSFLVTCDYDEQ